MPFEPVTRKQAIVRDIVAGLVVFLVAIPMCLGIALASKAPLFSGLVAGIVGGVVVGFLSRSQTSVTGPAAGLTTIVAAQLAALGSFEAFLLAVVGAGVIQLILGLCRAGFIAAFFPTSVIKGLLAAIGAIFVVKQIPHLLGHDTDPEGDLSFSQPDHENTLSELWHMVGDLHAGAAVIGLTSLALMALWETWTPLKKSKIPGALVVVAWGTTLAAIFRWTGGSWEIQQNHMVDVPIASDWASMSKLVVFPDFSRILDPAIHTAAMMIALFASLETLLNVEAVDKLDPRQRTTPASHELVAQGVGNICAGLIGGIPMTSVIVRGSVNINAGSQTKWSTIIHGGLIAVFALFLPQVVNLIPLSCLAAVLIVTGFKLISPSVWRQMWNEGTYQFIPFVLTTFAIFFTDLLQGVAIGLAMAITFILNSNFRRPLKTVVERHLGGDVVHIELANQVSFLNRAAIENALELIPQGGHVLLDATNTVYMDPDILSLIHEFKDKKGPARKVRVSLRGFREKYDLADDVQYIDYATRELQESLSPAEVIERLREGNARFRNGERLTRDLHRMMLITSKGQFPLAVVLSCIDSRTPTEYIFDLGLGDVFNIRIAGNVTSPRVLGSIEYACAVVGVRLIVVMGHTRCGAVSAAVNFTGNSDSVESITGCQHLNSILQDVQQSIDDSHERIKAMGDEERERFIDDTARRNVEHSVSRIVQQSRTIQNLVANKQVAVVGAMYDVNSGVVKFFEQGEPNAERSLGNNVAARRVDNDRDAWIDETRGAAS